jgi:hypothetical protein
MALPYRGNNNNKKKPPYEGLDTHAYGLWIGKCLLSCNYFSISLHSYNVRQDSTVK